MLSSKITILLLLPGIPAATLLVRLLDNPIPIVLRWAKFFLLGEWVGVSLDERPKTAPPPVGSQLLAYVLFMTMGYMATNHLVPKIKYYTLRKGISGKDLGKKGTSIADKEV